jgi:exopolysaccharide production protein ExoZ
MLLNVQMLRAVAAFMVVFVHLEALGKLAGFAPGWSFFGNAGVDLFFVISGMIMVMTTADGRQTAGGFLRNRIARVAPLYWAITFVTFAIAAVAPSLMGATTADPVQLVKSLLFVPFEKGNGMMHPTVFVGWTLNYEMMFYVLFALGMMLPGRRSGLVLSGGLLLAVVAAGLVLRPADPVLRFYAQPLVLEFAGGMILGAVLPRLPSARACRWPAVAVGSAAFAAMVAAGFLWPHTERALIFGVPAVAVVACAVIAERAGLTARAAWLQLLGAASYAVYLTHFFCTQAVVKIAERLDAGPAPALALFPIAFLLVAFVGVAAHRRVELPLTGLARRALSGPRPAAARRAVRLPASAERDPA